MKYCTGTQHGSATKKNLTVQKIEISSVVFVTTNRLGRWILSPTELSELPYLLPYAICSHVCVLFRRDCSDIKSIYSNVIHFSGMEQNPWIVVFWSMKAFFEISEDERTYNNTKYTKKWTKKSFDIQWWQEANNVYEHCLPERFHTFYLT